MPRRYLRQLDLPRRLHVACAGLGGDYSGARLGLLLMALLYAGARRLEHLQYLVGDPLARRFAGLARVPTVLTITKKRGIQNRQPTGNLGRSRKLPGGVRCGRSTLLTGV